MVTMLAIKAEPKALTLGEYFATGFFNKKDAGIIAPELIRLAERGTSNREEIVKAATPTKSPLHPYFEWTDSVAAHQYRLKQANDMANHIYVMVKDAKGESKPIRAFLAVTVKVEDGAEPITLKQYKTIPMVAKDPDATAEVIEQAYQSAVNWERRYAQYAETLPLFAQRFGKVISAIRELEEAI